MRRFRPAHLVLASTTVLLLAGCASDPPSPTAEDASSDPATATPTVRTTATPAKPTNTPTPTATPPEPTIAPPSETASQSAQQQGRTDLILSDVRYGKHEGYERVVWEFTGTIRPGWSVGYVDQPRFDGSGESVAVAGDSFLDVYASGVLIPESGFVDDPRRLRPRGQGVVAEVYASGGPFEGNLQSFIGLEGGPAPFRVSALTNPSRLVVDIGTE